MNYSDKVAQDFISNAVIFSFFYCFPASVMAKAFLSSRSDILMMPNTSFPALKKVQKLIRIELFVDYL